VHAPDDEQHEAPHERDRRHDAPQRARAGRPVANGSEGIARLGAAYQPREVGAKGHDDPNGLDRVLEGATTAFPGAPLAVEARPRPVVAPLGRPGTVIAPCVR
jgi:hypothetical protein